MKFFHAICLLLLPFAVLRADELQHDAGGIIIEPHQGSLDDGMTLSVTFPAAMVNTDSINAEGQPNPLVSAPKLPGNFLWKSQAEGEFTIGGALIPGTKYRVTLDPAIKDLSGKPVDAKNWGADFETVPFHFSVDADGYGLDERISSKPQVYLTSNYAVNFSEAAQHIYFQDRDSHVRLAAEVIVTSDEKPGTEGTEFRVAPRADLPVGRAFDLVIDGILDLHSKRPLPYLQVFPLGVTEPLKVEWAGAFNNALEPAQIIVKLNDTIEPEQVTPQLVKIDPPVKNLKLHAEEDSIVADGDFDTAARYAVTIAPELKGQRSYGLAAESRWHATFHAKPPSVVFPSDMIFQRAARGLRFSFLQINTPQLVWKLAAIPPEKLAAVSARLREYENEATDPLTGKTFTDPRTGFNKLRTTELLADAFNLKTVGSGNFAATSGDAQTLREIQWPGDATDASLRLAGAYLLEVSGELPGGRVVGNRSIISFSDVMLAQKRSATTVTVRAAKMSDGQPLTGATVRAVTKSNAELARAETDKQGFATFPRDAIFPAKKEQAHIFIADGPDGSSLQFVDGGQGYSSGMLRGDAKKQDAVLRSLIITDRNLYRPAQTVKFKGLLRLDTAGALSIPARAPVHWWITQDSRDEVLAEGRTVLTDDGGWDGEWEVPEKISLGDYAIHCEAGAWKTASGAAFKVDEYRVPLFSVEVAALNKVGASSQVKISSEYFHGAVNRGARVHWKATWDTLFNESRDGFQRYDAFTERDPHLAGVPVETKDVEGDATLDANGTATITCDAPFADGVARGRCDVIWRADVTSVDGQTLTAGASAPLQFVPALPGVKAGEQLTPQRAVKVELDAVDADDNPAASLDTEVELFHVVAKTAKEQVAPFVYHYRNTNVYTKVATQQAKAPGTLVFPVADTGKYVAVVTAKNQPHTPVVSADAYVSGEEPAEFPVQNETAFTITHDDKAFTSGATAVLHTQAPFGGIAWVSVETNEILDTLFVPVVGNSGMIELPIKKEYGPNIFVSVYLVKPGGANELPQERFAYTSLNVQVPERELNIVSHLEKETVRPGDKVRGELGVTSEGKPVANADLAVFAVDDAVLQLGGWALPGIGEIFYPQRPFGVASFGALGRYVADIKRESIFQKGFVIGDGGPEVFGSVQKVRKEFKTLAYWESSLKTDADGKIKFEFDAPDNLTTYRIVAVGQTRKNQFGADATAEVKISKPLIAEPALPRFLREGDEVDLRLVVRENFADNDEITVRCAPDARLQLVGESETTQKAVRDVPSVFRFKAKVVDPDCTPTAVRFDAVSKSNREAADSVQNTLPVHPPTVVRKESVAGTFDGAKFDPQQKMPDAWKRGRGAYDLTISTSPWLPKLTGLPQILDYPHGCFDQISTRMLGYALLGDLLAYLPNAELREKNYRAVIERGLKLYDQSLLPDGMLPYWNGEETGSPFCTIEAAWAVDEAVTAGFEPPPGLQEKLAGALKKIARGGEKNSAFEQTFALMVLSRKPQGENFSGVAQDLYLKRNKLTDEGRALLALALHQLGIMPSEKAQLMHEIDRPIDERAFDPDTFSSTTRDEAIRTLAFCKIAPDNWTAQKKETVRKRILEIMDSSASLSTQENLWLLLAFKAFSDAENFSPLNMQTSKSPRFSRNRASAGWPALALPAISGFFVGGFDGKSPLSYLMAAEYTTDEVETDRTDRGLRVERVVRNLTEPKRTGAAGAPFKLGDQMLITYRIFTRKLQNYVALEDLLPAGLETVNPDLPQIGKFFTLPPADPHSQQLDLSHSEMRDQSTLLYFDRVDPGTGTYSVLARATVAGTFRWPATQVVPMYDSRFSGLSPSSLCVVSGD
jgi:uncharacterized protein YfaS (alpha-2-macroglobulin family)